MVLIRVWQYYPAGVNKAGGMGWLSVTFHTPYRSTPHGLILHAVTVHRYLLAVTTWSVSSQRKEAYNLPMHDSALSNLTSALSIARVRRRLHDCSESESKTKTVELTGTVLRYTFYSAGVITESSMPNDRLDTGVQLQQPAASRCNVVTCR